jgi:hypothetical protein
MKNVCQPQRKLEVNLKKEATPGDINSKEALANMRVLFEVVVKQDDEQSRLK